MSSVFWADNLLDQPDSSLTYVDPFMTNNEEENFDFNISNCNNSDKISIRKITSDKYFETNDKYFNFIYIDGCHEPEFIIRDMMNSFKYLIKDGIMWMDSLLEEYRGEYVIIHKGYQLAIKKL